MTKAEIRKVTFYRKKPGFGYFVRINLPDCPIFLSLDLDSCSLEVKCCSLKVLLLLPFSRVGVDYLTNPACSRWTVCQTHRREFLDAWQVGKDCCHPKHNPDSKNKDASQPKHLVSCILNKVKKFATFAKQQWSNDINALTCVYCHFLRAELNG